MSVFFSFFLIYMYRLSFSPEDMDEGTDDCKTYKDVLTADNLFLWSFASYVIVFNSFVLKLSVELISVSEIIYIQAINI